MRRASDWTSPGQDAADYVVANGDAAQAHALVSSRGRTRTPVWSNAYNALVGLYFAEKTPEVNGAFLSALGDDTIAERLAKPVDRAQQLAGNIWFYYGSRYGEYSGVTRQGNPEDFLPAMLEQSPASASGYLTVADYYFDSGDTTRAIADYEHALELAPGRADVHDSLAVAYYKQGARAEAIAQWKQAFSTLRQQVNSARVPESFWTDFSRTCEHLRTRKLFNDLRPDVDALLRAYLRHNGNYRSNALLHSAYVATGDPAAATTLASGSGLSRGRSQRRPGRCRGGFMDPAGATRAHLSAHPAGEARRSIEGGRAAERSRATNSALVAGAMDQISGRDEAVRAGRRRDCRALPKETRTAEAAAIVPLELQVAAQTGTLDARIEELSHGSATIASAGSSACSGAAAVRFRRQTVSAQSAGVRFRA